MAKQGMKRPALSGDKKRVRKKNEVPPVPELQGKVKTGKKEADDPFSPIN